MILNSLEPVSLLIAHNISHSNLVHKDSKTPPAQQQSNSPDFEDWYLKQVTKEFADDIDKIRNASDFSDKSVPMLVAALKQGVSLFSEEERRIVMGS